MNIGTFNIRGCKNSLKRRLSQIILKGKVDLVFIQETKVMQMEDCMVSITWESKECDWSAKESEGQSGGILTTFDYTCAQLQGKMIYSG